MLSRDAENIRPVGERSHEGVGDELYHGLGGEHEDSLHILLQQLVMLPAHGAAQKQANVVTRR